MIGSAFKEQVILKCSGQGQGIHPVLGYVLHDDVPASTLQGCHCRTNCVLLKKTGAGTETAGKRERERGTETDRKREKEKKK